MEGSQPNHFLQLAFDSLRLRSGSMFRLQVRAGRSGYITPHVILTEVRLWHKEADEAERSHTSHCLHSKKIGDFWEQQGTIGQILRLLPLKAESAQNDCDLLSYCPKERVLLNTSESILYFSILTLHCLPYATLNDHREWRVYLLELESVFQLSAFIIRTGEQDDKDWRILNSRDRRPSSIVNRPKSA